MKARWCPVCGEAKRRTRALCDRCDTWDNRKALAARTVRVTCRGGK